VLLALAYRHRTPRFLLAAAPLVAVLLSACGAPPELRERSGAGPTPIVTTTGSPTVDPSPPLPVTTPLPDLPTRTPEPTTASQCTEGPTGAQIVALVRNAGILPGGVAARARTGPLCAAGWQYTVLSVTGHEELQVVTRGQPGSLTIVTVGTDVCTVDVRTTGPAAVRTLACDSSSGR
jgi:hypothetical protein